jgi:hypothetical protein
MKHTPKTSTFIQIPLTAAASSKVCYVYDLDGTLLNPGFITNDEFTRTNIRSQKIVLDLSSLQPKNAVGAILTYRPSLIADETLKQLEPIKPLLHTLYMRVLEHYLHYTLDSVLEYKISKLERLARTYDQVYFYDDTIGVVQEAARIRNLKAFHVKHTLVNDEVIPTIQEVPYARGISLRS